jgi:H+/Cl- antiporter ClcA
MLNRKTRLEFLSEQRLLLLHIAKSMVLGSLVGTLSGIGSAFFLIGLEWASHTRETNPWLLFLLPVGGGFIGWIYAKFGQEVEGGNNLILDQIHEPAAYVSWRMAPLIALSTIGTHLFGGSAGREGTAVQMGGSLADGVARRFGMSQSDRRILLMSGISGGFGSVFGTPLAGAVFGMEVLAIGRMRYDALLPCFVASTVGDLVCQALGVTHHDYHLSNTPSITQPMLAWILVASITFGLASLLFAELTHALGHLFKRLIKNPVVRPVVGGILIILMTQLMGNRDYLGLSLPLIERSFTPEHIPSLAFAFKILFTSVTLGSGFKGGEVTPLFCIGATLGHSFAAWTGQPVQVFAAVGFVAVFSGAANTPLSCVLMGVELFGDQLAVPLMLGCIVSYIVSGHRGIYLSQRIHTPKHNCDNPYSGKTLREINKTH